MVCGRLSSGRTLTAIEASVLLSVILLLAALIVPELLAMREKNRRATCSYNLKQIGFAQQCYHDFHLVFPSGYLHMVCPAGSEAHPGGRMREQINHPFLASLIQMDQARIFNGWNFELPIDAPRCGYAGDVNATMREARFNVLLCPSDRSVNWRYSYRAVTGSRPSQEVDEDEADEWKANGFYYHGSSVTRSDVTDGASYTAMFTERLMCGGAGRRGRTVILDAAANFSERACIISKSYFMDQGVNVSGTYESVTIPFVRPPNSTVVGCLCKAPEAIAYRAFDGPSSQHSGGVNVLMADGAVRFIEDNVNADAWRSLATIARGEALARGSY